MKTMKSKLLLAVSVLAVSFAAHAAEQTAEKKAVSPVAGGNAAMPTLPPTGMMPEGMPKMPPMPSMPSGKEGIPPSMAGMKMPPSPMELVAKLPKARQDAFNAALQQAQQSSTGSANEIMQKQGALREAMVADKFDEAQYRRLSLEIQDATAKQKKASEDPIIKFAASASKQERELLAQMTGPMMGGMPMMMVPPSMPPMGNMPSGMGMSEMPKVGERPAPPPGANPAGINAVKPAGTAKPATEFNWKQ